MIDDNTALVLVATINVIGIFITAYFGYKAAVNAKQAVMHAENSIAISKGNAEKLDTLKENVQHVEVGMNGMKEELVRKTAEAAKAEGKEEGKKEAEALATVVAAVVADTIGNKK